MRGWEYVGRIHDVEWHEIALDGFGDQLRIQSGDIVAVSPHDGGELRFGTFQVAHVGEDIVVARGHAGVMGNIPSVAERDFVYVARAIGEGVFRRVESADNAID